MKRRDFLKKAGIGAVAASTVFGPVWAQVGAPRLRWRMASSYPRALDILFGGAERFAKNVEAMTEGRFQISVHPAGEIAPALEVFEVVRRGAVEMGHAPSFWFMGLSPSFVFDSTLPFGLTAVQQNAWHHHGGGLTTMQQVLADFNAIHFPAGNTLAQMGGWFRREIRAMADVRGLRIRMPGLGGEVWTRLGATTHLIPAGELFLALERGVVDAADWSGAHDDLRLGLHRAARFYYYPGWQEPSLAIHLFVNLVRWRELPSDYQEIVKTAANDVTIQMMAEYDAKNGPAMDLLIRGGTQLRAFPRPLLLAAERHSEEICDEIAARDTTFRRILTDWRRFREIVRRGNRFTEYGYKSFVFSPR